MRRIAAWAAIVAIASAPAVAQPLGAEKPSMSPQRTEWPCDQPLRPEISVGAMWSGPDPATATENWKDNPAVATLVAQVAPRRISQEQAIADIHRFAVGFQGEQRTKIMTLVFAGLFETLNAERSAIIRGIRDFHRRQDALSKRIQEAWVKLGNMEPKPADPAQMERHAELQQQIDWDTRIFDDRQRLLPAVCNQPQLIEQRLYALSRAIQQEMEAP